VKACLGIDASRATLDGVLERFDAHPVSQNHMQVPNTPQGVDTLFAWACRKLRCRASGLRVVLEACGPHFLAAQELHSRGCEVVLANSKRVHDYANAAGRWTKNDRIDATAIAGFGVHTPVRVWQPPPAEVRELLDLLARKNALERLLLQDQARADGSRYRPLTAEIERSLRDTAAFLALENERVCDEIERLLCRHPQLARDRDLLMSIPGVGAALSLTLVGVFRSKEFSSAREAAAYCGLVPIHKHSGTLSHISGHIPRNCRRDVRTALYMPAMVATRHHPPLKARYEALIACGKHHSQAMVAVAHWMVRIAFGVFRNQRPYRPDWGFLSPQERMQQAANVSLKRRRRHDSARVNKLANEMRHRTQSLSGMKGASATDAQPRPQSAIETALANRRIKPRWTEEELMLLRDRAGLEPTKSLAAQLKRTHMSVRVKASQLHIPLLRSRQEQGLSAAQSPSRWTQQELTLLSERAGLDSAESLAAQLKRTACSVIQKASRLCIPLRRARDGRTRPTANTAARHRRITPRWTDEQILLLRARAGTDSVSSLAAHLQRTRNSVRLKASMLGLSVRATGNPPQKTAPTSKLSESSRVRPNAHGRLRKVERRTAIVRRHRGRGRE
jgi:transposase